MIQTQVLRSSAPKRAAHTVASAQRTTSTILPPSVLAVYQPPKAGSSFTQSEIQHEPLDYAQVMTFRKQHSAYLVLNRPSQLNSLNTNMLKIISSSLETAKQDDRISSIIMKGKGRAFCSGADIEEVTSGRKTLASNLEYARAEYQILSRMAKSSTPIVSLMDGFTMGAGAGLAMGSQVRVATEKTLFAMPECMIGFFVDAGASHFLSRLDGALGAYIALTGARLSGMDMRIIGLADHYVDGAHLEELEAALDSISASSSSKSLITSATESLSTGPSDENYATSIVSGPYRQAIDSCFSRDSILEIVDALETMAGEKGEKDPVMSKWAKKAAEKIRLSSPMSLTISWEAQRRGRHMTRDEVLQLEAHLACKIIQDPENGDFEIGVKHHLLEKRKDRASWTIPRLEDLDLKDVEKTYFGTPPPPLF